MFPLFQTRNVRFATRAIYMLVFALFCFACKHKEHLKQEKFDKVKWAILEGGEYPYRNAMLQDLIDHYALHGLKKDSVINLLGPPTHMENSHLYYLVDQQLIAKSFPLHTKTLVIKLTKDSTVEWRKIHE